MFRMTMVMMVVGVTLGSIAGCGPSRHSQENMARNAEQAQEPNASPARQDLLPPPGNDPRLRK
jgi:hypothetical protein